eukprot:462916-Rhodomonas_salina.2
MQVHSQATDERAQNWRAHTRPPSTRHQTTLHKSTEKASTTHPTAHAHQNTASATHQPLSLAHRLHHTCARCATCASVLGPPDTISPHPLSHTDRRKAENTPVSDACDRQERQHRAA